jgi:hypothetical protein
LPVVLVEQEQTPLMVVKVDLEDLLDHREDLITYPEGLVAAAEAAAAWVLVDKVDLQVDQDQQDQQVLQEVLLLDNQEELHLQ